MGVRAGGRVRGRVRVRGVLPRLGLIGTGDGGCVASRGSLAYEASWVWELKGSEP